MIISTFYKENVSGPRAEVVSVDSGYAINYFDVNGDMVRTENFEGKSLYFVESAAENWTMGIKNLNG